MAITEVIQMKIRDDINDSDFVSIMDDLEINFHMTFEGYIDSELFKEDDNTWRMIMHWESKKLLQIASKSMMNSDLTLKFRSCLIPENVKITVYDQICSWKKR